ncbi:hypothetical protein [Qipengyuania huizhouensis]|uniref:hypothetical protein n=1 Tax=Qipengyuania huizhouensis TaxID=2867245 RepID=UPI001C87C301|nr:hypothetical protein [Qipengyuania huizhouensis]MBX7459534.1 hypothetical protein [Qipengyuania huizhouensis]
MSGSGLLPAIPPGIALRLSAEVSDFAEGEAVSETVGRRTERADTLCYLARKRDNALRIASRSPDQEEHARSTARAMSVAIDDLSGGLHEGESLVSARPSACGLEKVA